MATERQAYTKTTLCQAASGLNMATKATHAACLQLIATQRDEAAFTEIFTFFAPKVRNYGLRHLRADGQAMELVQETMALVWNKAHLYHAEKGSAATWIYTLMRNACFDMLRKVKNNREDCISDDLWPTLNIHSDYPQHSDSAGLERCYHDELLDCIEQLPIRQQQVVRGVYLKQLTHNELAEQLSLPIGTVKSRLRLGIEKLRVQLIDNEIAEEDSTITSAAANDNLSADSAEIKSSETNSRAQNNSSLNNCTVNKRAVNNDALNDNAINTKATPQTAVINNERTENDD